MFNIVFTCIFGGWVKVMSEQMSHSFKVDEEKNVPMSKCPSEH